MKVCISEIWSRLSERDVLISLTSLAASANNALYLVGGTVRDLLLGRETEDLDFAVDGDSLSFARQFADMVHASFVLLDEEHGTARVVLRGGDLYMDFSRIRDENITADLKARDFTINAMAIDLSRVSDAGSIETSELEVIDPCGGVEDLSNRLIRLASARSIEDDPVRMLRVYRFAATLGFAIHDSILTAIRDSLGLLCSISVERIRDEIFKTLAADDSVHQLEAMDDIGLLERVFPEIARMKGMEQNEYHHLDVWGHSRLTLEFFEQELALDSLKSYISEVEKYLEHEPVKGRSRRSLLKLAALLHDVGKPDARIVDEDGRIRFFDHDKEGAEIIRNMGRRLKLAKREISSLENIIENHMYPLGLSVFLRKSKGWKTKNRTMRRFIQRTGPEWLAILLLSFADLRATQGPLRRPDELDELARLIGEIAGIYFQENRSPMPRLVSGSDLMEKFGVPASPDIGRLLEKVREAQIDGTVKTRSDAMNMVRDILSREK